MTISGEIDESSGRFLADALALLTSDLDVVHLDLRGVEYCDIAGLRVMVQLTATGVRDGDHAARRVVLHGAAPDLIAVLGILGWDRTPGLIVDGWTRTISPAHNADRPGSPVADDCLTRKR